MLISYKLPEKKLLLKYIYYIDNKGEEKLIFRYGIKENDERQHMTSDIKELGEKYKSKVFNWINNNRDWLSSLKNM